MDDADVEAVERVFNLTDSFLSNGCEHGFKPAKSCPNIACDTKDAQAAWERIQKRLMCDAAKS